MAKALRATSTSPNSTTQPRAKAISAISTRSSPARATSIAGGAYDYIINGNMIAGFGLIAWPAKYGETGVKTFAVNQHGVVYETDLGPATTGIVKYIDRFNPDDTWEIVAD